MTADKIWSSPPIGGERVIEKWEILDEWWTGKSTLRQFRVVEIAGKYCEQFRGNSTNWKWAPIK